MNGEHDRRSADSPIRVWGPTAAMIGAIAVAWGGMSSQLSQVVSTQQALVSDVRELRDARTRGDVTIDGLRDKLSAAEVSSSVISELSRQMGEIATRVRALEANMRQVWPRLRAHDSNEVLLQRGLEKLGVELELETPEKF